MSFIYFGAKRYFGKIFYNSEFLVYMSICIIFSVIISASLYFSGIFNPLNAAINGTFQVVSVITTTGFYTSDYSLWGNFVVLLIFLLMFTGGTTGSASSGIKMTRIMIMTRNNRMELRRLVHPNAYIPVRLNKKIVPQGIVYNVLVFIMLYFLITCASAVIISLMGYDIITSFGTAVAMLGNIGPGMGSLGPFSNYSMVPVAGKWFFSGLMLLGRLEIMTIMILFARSFYRK